MWLDEDQDKVNAWLRHRREICPRCGTAEADWVDLTTKHRLDSPKWEAMTFRCPGCQEVERVGEEIPREERGVRVVLLPYSADEEVNDAF